MSDRKMSLSMFCGGLGGYHQAGWRDPESHVDGGDITFWIQLAQRLEAAKFDMLFVADLASMPNADNSEIFRYSSIGETLEPMTMLAALATSTKHIGLAGTIATSYRPPYDAARELASLDVISGGRAGWNIVTGISPDDATQYADQKFPPPELRYKRGEEFVDVVLKLWDSVKPGAAIRDKESGVFWDNSKIDLISHQGEYYKVRGPLNVPPSPQQRPVLIQAGQSEEGRQLASRVAEAVFTAQSDFDLAKGFRDDIRSRAARWGRNPDHLKILPGCVVILGETRQEADDKWEELNSRIDLRPAMARLQMNLKFVDLSSFDLDAPFPDVPPEAVISRGANLVKEAKLEGLTLRQVLIRSSGANAHFICRGTVKDVTDELQHWFEGGACDGFNMQSAVMPTSIYEFIENVVPELQRRGLFRTEYEGTTLRESLGIPADPIPMGAS